MTTGGRAAACPSRISAGPAAASAAATCSTVRRSISLLSSAERLAISSSMPLRDPRKIADFLWPGSREPVLRVPAGPPPRIGVAGPPHWRRPGPASQELTTATASISIMKSGLARRVTPTVGFVDLSYNRVPRASFVRALASKGRTDRAALADLGKPASLNVLLEDLLWRMS